MDTKLVIIGAVVLTVVVGGLGWTVMHQSAGPPPATAVAPASQLTNELPAAKPATGVKAVAGDVTPAGHSNE